MQDEIDTGAGGPAGLEITDIALDQLATASAAVEVLDPSGTQIVQHSDFRALLQESIDEVGTDEAGTSGDQDGCLSE
jgi:hypothetical protein